MLLFISILKASFQKCFQTTPSFVQNKAIIFMIVICNSVSASFCYKEEYE